MSKEDKAGLIIAILGLISIYLTMFAARGGF